MQFSPPVRPAGFFWEATSRTCRQPGCPKDGETSLWVQENRQEGEDFDMAVDEKECW